MERSTVERSARHEVRRHQRRLGRTHARGRAARRGRKPQAPGGRRGLGDVEDHRSAARARCATPKAATAPAWRPICARLRERHEQACRELLPASAATRGSGQADRRSIDEFERIVNGMAMLTSARRARWMKASPWASGSRRCWSPSICIAEGIAGRSRECVGRRGHRRRLRQRVAADGAHAREGRRASAAAARARRHADRHRLQRRHRRWTPHHARPRRLGFFGVHSGRRAGRRRALDLDRRRRHHERRSAPGARRRSAGRNHLRRGRRAGLQRRQGAASAHAGAAGRKEDSGVEQEQLRARKAGHAHRAADPSRRPARAP